MSGSGLGPYNYSFTASGGVLDLAVVPVGLVYQLLVDPGNGYDLTNGNASQNGTVVLANGSVVSPLTYSVNAANNAITFNIASLKPNQTYTVLLDIYGNVLDAGNDIANWAAANASNPQETTPGETYAQAIANGDLALQKSYKKPGGLPTVNVGIMQAALSFANVSTNTTLAGTIAGSVQGDNLAATAVTNVATQVGGWGGNTNFASGNPAVSDG